MGRKRSILLFVLAGLLLAALSGAAGQGSPPLRLSEKDTGRTREVRVGDRVDLILPENGTTGFQWEVAAMAENVIRPEGRPEFAPEGGATGAGGKKTFHFVAVARGEAFLTLVYRRSWEANVPPAATFSVTIRVR